MFSKKDAYNCQICNLEGNKMSIASFSLYEMYSFYYTPHPTTRVLGPRGRWSMRRSSRALCPPFSPKCRQHSESWASLATHSANRAPASSKAADCFPTVCFVCVGVLGGRADGSNRPPWYRGKKGFPINQGRRCYGSWIPIDRSVDSKHPHNNRPYFILQFK